MPPSYRISAAALLFCAFFLSFLVSISLPTIRTMDIARVHFGDGGPILRDGLIELRLGIWSACYYSSTGDRLCLPSGHGYAAPILNSDGSQLVIIGSSWTRGLAIHPVACAITFVAFVMSFFQHLTLGLPTSCIASFFAALMTLLAFAVDIALYVYVHHIAGTLSKVDENTDTAPGFWMTFVSLILLIAAGCTIFMGHRKSGADSYPSYPLSTTQSGGFLSKFRK